MSTRPSPVADLTTFDAFEQLDRELSALFDVRLAAVTRCLERAAERAADFRRIAPAPGQHPYNKVVLKRSDDIEATLLGWAPNDECAPHDHGASSCAILVCSGVLRNTEYTLKNGDIVRSASATWAPGSIVTTEPNAIHAMGSATGVGLVTLHVYWPPMADMNIFDVQRKRVYAVDDAAGAWLPVDEQHLRSVNIL